MEINLEKITKEITTKEFTKALNQQIITNIKSDINYYFEQYSTFDISDTLNDVMSKINDEMSKTMGKYIEQMFFRCILDIMIKKNYVKELSNGDLTWLNK